MMVVSLICFVVPERSVQKQHSPIWCTIVQQKEHTNKYIIKYEKHFPKMYRDVGMAVPKTTQTRYMDGTVQATQRTTQITPSLHHFSFLLSTQSCFQYSDTKS